MLWSDIIFYQILQIWFGFRTDSDVKFQFFLDLKNFHLFLRDTEKNQRVNLEGVSKKSIEQRG